MKTIVHIGGLLVMEGEGFIRNLYFNFLGRAPDEMGLQFYSYRLYRGDRKEKLILDIVRSAECKINPADIVGLDALLRRERRRAAYPYRLWYTAADLFRAKSVILPAASPSHGASFLPDTTRDPGIDDAALTGEISAAIEGLDSAHKAILAQIERQSDTVARIKKHVDLLVLHDRVLYPWTLDSLLRLEGRDLIDTAYRVFVRRECNDEEAGYFMGLIERGEDKLAILSHLCESWEVGNNPCRSDWQDMQLDLICAAVEGMSQARQAQPVLEARA